MLELLLLLTFWTLSVNARTSCPVGVFLPYESRALTTPPFDSPSIYPNGTILRSVYEAAFSFVASRRSLLHTTNLELQPAWYTIGNAQDAEDIGLAKTHLADLESAHPTAVGLLGPSVLGSVAKAVSDDANLKVPMLTRLPRGDVSRVGEMVFRTGLPIVSYAHSAVDTLFALGVRTMGILIVASDDSGERSYQTHIADAYVASRVDSNGMELASTWTLRADQGEPTEEPRQTVFNELRSFFEHKADVGLVVILPSDGAIGLAETADFIRDTKHSGKYSFVNFMHARNASWSAIGGQLGTSMAQVGPLSQFLLEQHISETQLSALRALLAPSTAPFLFERLQRFTTYVPNALSGGLAAWDRLVSSNGVLITQLQVAFDSVIMLSRAVAMATKSPSVCPSASDVVSKFFKLDMMGATGRVKFRSVNHGERSELNVRLFQVNTTSDDIPISSPGVFAPISRWSEALFFKWLSPRALTTSGEVIDTAKQPLDIPNQLDKWVWVPDIGLAPNIGWGYCADIWKKDTEDEFVIVYGGKDPTTVFDRMFQLDLKRNRWVEIFPASMTQRPASAFHSCKIVGDTLVVYGGQDAEDLPVGEMWAFDLTTSLWYDLSNPYQVTPPARWGQGMIAVNDTAVLLFGGRGDSGLLNDVWEYSLTNNVWRELKPTGDEIPPRAFFTMVAPPSDDDQTRYFLVWGGRTSMLNKPLVVHVEELQSNDLFRFDLHTVEWKKIHQVNEPSPRFGSGGAMVGEKNNFEVAFGFTFMNKGSVLTDWMHTDVSEVVNSSVADPVVVWEPTAFNAGIRPRYFFPLIGWDVSMLVYSGKVLDDHNPLTADDKFVKDLWSCYSRTASHVLSTCLRIHGHYWSPVHGVARASSWLYGIYVYLFGGRQVVDSQQKPSSSVMRFDTEHFLWEAVPANTIEPPARYDHCGVALGDRYYVFGGVTGPRAGLNDVWAFFPLTQDWIPVDYTGHVMKATWAHTCARLTNRKFVVIGGYSTVNALTYYGRQYFIFNGEGKNFTEPIKVNGTKVIGMPPPQSLLYCNSFVHDKMLYIEGCQDEDAIPYEYIWGLNLTSRFWEVAIPVPPAFQSSWHSLVHIGGPRFAFMGGVVDDALITSMAALVDVSTRQVVPLLIPKTHNTPRPREAATCQYFKNRMLCIGGIMGSPVFVPGFHEYDLATPIPSNIVSDTWVYAFNSLCELGSNDTNCAFCSHGSEARGRICDLCPPNSYSNKTSMIGSNSTCYRCQKEYIGTVLGAGSSNFCYPTKKWFERTINNGTPSLTQPVPFVKKTIGCFATFGLVWLIFVIVSLCLWNRGCIKPKYILFCNFMFANRHGVLQDPRGKYYAATQITKRTFLGSYCSLLAISAVVAMLLANFIIFFTGWADDEVRSLLPQLAETVNPMFYINGKVHLYNFEGACQANPSDKHYGECAEWVGCSSSNIEPAGLLTHCNCKMANDKAQPYCAIRFKCAKCNFGTWKESNITVTAAGPNSFTTGYLYKLSVSTGYEAPHNNTEATKLSIIEGTIASPHLRVFRGLGHTSRIRISVIPTNYTRLLAFGRSLGRGYHLDYKTIVEGTKVKESTFHDENGFSFAFDITESDNTLVILRSSSSSIFTFIPRVLASSVGILGIFGIIMYFIEIFLGLLGVPDDLPALEAWREKRAQKKAGLDDDSDDGDDGTTPLIDGTEVGLGEDYGAVDGPRQRRPEELEEGGDDDAGDGGGGGAKESVTQVTQPIDIDRAKSPAAAAMDGSINSDQDDDDSPLLAIGRTGKVVVVEPGSSLDTRE